MTTFLVLIALIAPLPAAEPAAPPAAEGGKAPRARSPVTDRPNLGVQTLPIRPGEKNDGVRINCTIPGSAAEAMGLKSGDEVLELNGAPVPTRMTFAQELQRLATGTEVVLQVRRGAETVKIRGPMGSFVKTRQAFFDYLGRNVVGKPISTAGEILWPDGVDGITLMKGKVAVVVCFDNCPDCIQGNFLRLADRFVKLKELKQNWVDICALYTNINASHQKNLEDRKRILEAYPVKFPVGMVRYEDDLAPPDSFRQEPFIQHHGLAVIDPQGKILYLEITSYKSDNAAMELTNALADAARKFAPVLPPPGPTGSPPSSPGTPKGAAAPAGEPEKKAEPGEKTSSGAEK